MRILHLSDLHLGIKLYEYSLIEEQVDFLKKLIRLISNESIDAVIIAGDVYDKATPRVDAVEIFDEFLVKLNEMDLPVFVISGNHDNAVRLSFAGRLLEENNIHISPDFNGEITKISKQENDNTINFYLIPFLRPSTVRYFLKDEEIKSYDDAMRAVISRLEVNEEEINILVTHQFVAGGVCCDSDDVSVGGIENIRADAFNKFDYVALGHLHNAQSVMRKTVRYCGSPLKYSVSEENVRKSITIVDIIDKSKINIEEHYIRPMRDIRLIRGSYDELMNYENYKNTNTEDYVQVILSDNEPVFDAVKKLRTVYPNILSLKYEKAFNQSPVYENVNALQSKNPVDIVKEFYISQNGVEMNEMQLRIIESEIKDIWSGTNETN